MRSENSPRDVLTSLGRLGGWWRLGGDGMGKSADEQDELPALVIGELSFVGRHGFVALGDDVEKLAVGDGAEMRGVSQHSGTWIVHFCLRAISLPCFAVTLGAFVEVHGEDLFRGGSGVDC